MLLKKSETAFVLVDVQGKLAKIVHESEALLEKLQQLIRGLRLLEVPIIWLEQYPQGLGRTSEELTQHLSGLEPIEKITFSACKNEEFMRALKETNCQHVLVAGIETHICVYQTAVDLKENGYRVQVVEDAVSSRTLANKQVGLNKLKSLGIMGTSVEMALYELLETAGTEQFKQMLTIIK